MLLYRDRQLPCKVKCLNERFEAFLPGSRLPWQSTQGTTFVGTHLWFEWCQRREGLEVSRLHTENTSSAWKLLSGVYSMFRFTFVYPMSREMFGYSNQLDFESSLNAVWSTPQVPHRLPHGKRVRRLLVWLSTANADPTLANDFESG